MMHYSELFPEYNGPGKMDTTWWARYGLEESAMNEDATGEMPAHDRLAALMRGEEVASGDDEIVAYCPACGQPIDSCLGHGAIGDPRGHEMLRLHDEDIHEACDPNGCEERARHILPDGVRDIEIRDYFFVCLSCGEAFGKDDTARYAKEHEDNDHPGETDISYGLLHESEAI